MPSDTATPVAAPRADAPRAVGWRWIGALAGGVVGAVAAYGVGVVLPFYANGLDRLPLSDVTDGTHDPMDVAPADPWAALERLVGYVGLALVPVVALLSVALGVTWLTLLWRRPGAQRVPKTLALLAAVAASVSALLFLSSPVGMALSTWRLDY